MAEFVYREAAPVREDALTVSGRILGRHLSISTEANPRRDALAVSSDIRKRNFLRARQIFGTAIALILMLGLATALLHGIDFSSLVPPGLFESSASYSGAPVHNIFQPSFGDFTRVQEPYWWLTVPEKARELGHVVANAPMPVKGAVAMGVTMTALWWKFALGFWSNNNKHGGGDDNEREI